MKRISGIDVVWWLLFAVVLGVGAWFRLAGGNWDRGLQLNVDDTFVAKTAMRRVNMPPGTSIATLLDPRESPINPRTNGDFFPYGTLPIYVTKGAATSAHAVTGDPYFTGLGGVQLTGRAMSGLFDLAVVVVLVVLGTRLFSSSRFNVLSSRLTNGEGRISPDTRHPTPDLGRWWGLAAGALYAFAILPIQTSHFFITDSFMAAFMAATLLCGVALLQTGRLWLAPVAGACAGLAMACKLSAAPVLVVPVAAVVLRVLIEGKDEGKTAGTTLGRGALMVALVGAGTFVGLFVGDPYAVLDPGPYLVQLQEQAAIQNGSIDEWFTRKYVGTWPLLHPWGQLILLGVGPLVGIAGTLGVGVAVWRAWRREWVWALLLLGAGAYFAAIGFAEAKWVRYLLPLVPYLCLFAVGFCVWVVEWAKERELPSSVRYAVPGVLVGSALVGAVAVMPIYRTEHTQIEASRWIYDNVPQGSPIGIETTAIRMPLGLPGKPDPAAHYSQVEWNPLADATSEEAAANLRRHLEGSDYLVLDSTQAARTAPRLPWRYPVQARYYDLLFSGKLGFTLAHKAVSYPRIGPLEMPDEGWADVSFMDSSHPPVYVFKKERVLGDEEWAGLFGEVATQPSVATRHSP